MKREVALKIVLMVVGLLFLALVYPMKLMMRQDPALSMMLSLYVTLGIFLVLAIRNPAGHRSLIASSPPGRALPTLRSWARSHGFTSSSAEN